LKPQPISWLRIEADDKAQYRTDNSFPVVAAKADVGIWNTLFDGAFAVYSTLEYLHLYATLAVLAMNLAG